MDIMLVFETSGVGSIPASPATVVFLQLAKTELTTPGRGYIIET
jgi:hypothetical protein